MTINTITNAGNQLSAEDRISYRKMLLTNLYHKIVFGDFGTKDSLPLNEGTTLNFRRYNKFTVSSSPQALSEGITPVAAPITYTPITCIPNQYGQYVIIPDRLKLQGIDDNIEHSSFELGKWGGVTADTVIRNILVLGANAQFQGGKSQRSQLDNTSKITVTGLKKAKRTLAGLDVMPVEKEGYYVVILNEYQAHDLTEDPDWKENVKFSDPTRLIKGEVGVIFGIKVVISNNVYVVQGGGASTSVSGIATTSVSGTQTADVHLALMMGEEAYGIADLNKISPEIFIKQAHEAGGSDPLEQRNTVCIKFYQGAVILDDQRMVRIETTVSN